MKSRLTHRRDVLGSCLTQSTGVGAQRLPDIDYIPQHAADSLKRSASRTEASGQFGIGIYTFWGLGEKLSLVTRAQRPSGMTDTFQLTLEAEKQETIVERTGIDPILSSDSRDDHFGRRSKARSKA